ncbi:hypothetical protein R1flu_029225 [Riccia fluitans]|uniref:Transglycosylase SLT domain-containing protein n=1 Tax=Riccia fluitans TaxID=41844 RepID=A0ABD1XNY0_9MARC
MRGRGGPLRGSWAGAMGQCQFLPSSFRQMQLNMTEMAEEVGFRRNSCGDLFSLVVYAMLFHMVKRLLDISASNNSFLGNWLRLCSRCTP